MAGSDWMWHFAKLGGWMEPIGIQLNCFSIMSLVNVNLDVFLIRPPEIIQPVQSAMQSQHFCSDVDRPVNRHRRETRNSGKTWKVRRLALAKIISNGCLIDATKNDNDFFY